MEQLDRYSIHLFVDDQDGSYVATCPEFPGVSAFGDTREQALVEVRVALEAAAETFAEEGWPLPEPQAIPQAALPSGEFRVRVPKSLHALLSKRAESEGVSQNQLVVYLLAEGLATRRLVAESEALLRATVEGLGLRARAASHADDPLPASNGLLPLYERGQAGESTTANWEPHGQAAGSTIGVRTRVLVLGEVN